MGQCAEREGAGGRREGSGERARERSGGRRRRVEDVKQRNEFGMLPEGRAGGEAAAEEERRRAWWHLVVVRTEMAENGGERVIRVSVGWLPVGCLDRERPKEKCIIDVNPCARESDPNMTIIGRVRSAQQCGGSQKTVGF